MNESQNNDAMKESNSNNNYQPKNNKGLIIVLIILLIISLSAVVYFAFFKDKINISIEYNNQKENNNEIEQQEKTLDEKNKQENEVNNNLEIVYNMFYTFGKEECENDEDDYECYNSIKLSLRKDGTYLYNNHSFAYTPIVGNYEIDGDKITLSPVIQYESDVTFHKLKNDEKSNMIVTFKNGKFILNDEIAINSNYDKKTTEFSLKLTNEKDDDEWYIINPVNGKRPTGKTNADESEYWIEY